MSLSEKRQEFFKRYEFTKYINVKTSLHKLIKEIEKQDKEFIKELKKWNENINDERNLKTFLKEEAGENLK